MAETVRKGEPLVNWKEVGRFRWRCHEGLLQKHGLVDCFCMAAALYDAARGAAALLGRQGYSAVGDWLLRELPSVPAMVLPEYVAEPVWTRSSWKWGGEGPGRWAVLWDPPHMWELEYLDRNKGLTPRVWVRREWIRLGGALRKQLAESQFARVFSNHPLLELPSGDSDVWETGWILGMEPANNQWWAAERWTAASRLARVSGNGIERRTAVGEYLKGGGRDSVRYWDVVYRRRMARLPYAGNPDEGEEKHPVVGILLPELGAIPFYHVSQFGALHEAVVQGRVSFSLLSDLSDAEFKQGTIAALREELEYPHLETRGRPRRPRDRVEEVGRLIDGGMPKYRVAKTLDMSRSAVYDYYRDYVASGAGDEQSEEA